MCYKVLFEHNLDDREQDRKEDMQQRKRDIR